MRTRIPVLPLVLASIVGCNGNCSQNAVFVAEQAKRLGPTIDTIEAYSDLNGDGELTDGTNMSFVDERGFVIDPRAGVRKALRIRFMLPESRQLLLLPPPCLVDPLDPNSTCPPSFLTFSSLFDPCPNPDSPDCHPWVSDVYFNDDPTDHETAGTTQDVTYVLYDDLVTPFLSTTPMPVKVDIGLDQLDPTNEPAEFVFVLARQTLSPVPPRIVSMSPSPFPPLPGWGRPINAQDFAGRQLADVLALVDQNEMGTGANLFQRVAPHNGIDMRFDAPIENVVVSIALRPSVPEITPPFGIELGASTIAFLTPFQEATSDTAVGMAPDQVYTVKVLSSSDVAFAPVLRGTESDIGRFLMPDFDDDRYQFLRGAGYTDYQLANSVKFTFRTGPFRITQPVHHGGTNATTAPNGMFTAQLQFARPSDPLPSPTTVTITISPHGLATTTSSLGFPSGSADTIQQDGFVRSNGVTTHAVPIQLPAEPFDDVVDIDMAVFSGPTLADLVGHDKIQIHHDNIVPTIDNNVSVTNTYTDGALDQVCLTSDCDVASFDVSTAESPRCRIPFNQCAAGSVCVAGTCASVISRSQATSVSTCSNGRAQYCFSDVSLGLASNVVEGPLDVTFRAIDDQGNVSDPVTVHTEPTCRDFGKFVAADGRRSAIVTADDGTPLVAWTSDTALRYAEPEAPPSANTGRWSRHAQTVAQLGAGETFGLGIDLALDPVTRRPVVCFVQGAAAATDVDAVGTLHVLEQDPTGAWAELSARPGVQPLGCSLSSLGNSILVGWIEQQRPRWGFGDSLTIDHAPLPLPNAAFPGAQLQYWDLDVVGFNDRIWFTYRSQNAQLADTPGAPGSIFIGSTDSGGQAPVVQVVCPPFRKCPGIGQSYGTGNPLTEGWAPRIVVDDQGVGVAYVSVEDDGNFSFEHHRALEVLAGGVPVGNQPVTFTAYHHEEAAPALGGYTGDGVSPAGIIETPFSRPALVRDVDGPILLASWARNTTQSLPGNEDVAVLHYNPLDDSSFVVVVDRRVSNDDAAHSEAVPVHVSRGPHGYQLVYRNPATGMLEFAAEQETLPQSGPAGRFACGRAWSSSVLSEDELNLKYAIPNQLWAPSCAGTSPSLSLTRPFVFGGETLARPNSTVIDDIVTTSTASVDKHMVLRNGRVPLKEQLRVCRPLNANGEIDDQVCDPLKTLNGTVTPPPTNTCGAQGAHCIQGEDCCSGVCRIGGRCAGSPGSSTTCPAVSPGDTTRGDMDWILSPDAQTCSRCTPGSTPHPCLNNADCLIFGGPAANNGASSVARCSSAPWAQTNVCVPRCNSDADCHGGVCDRSDANDPGICRNSSGQESPPAVNLLCRPIGCDQCWNNDFCSNDQACPHNHACWGDSAGESTTVEAPLCILRPLLSPTSEAAFAGSLTAAQVKKLHDVRQLLTNLINTVELPYRFPGPGFPYGDCEISGIKATVHDIHVSTDATKNLVELTINFDQSTFTVCFDNRHDVDTDGSWAIHIFFAPFVGPRLNSGLDAATAYSGVTFTLVDVQVTGELDTPGPDVDLSFLDDQLTEALRPFANQTIAGIMLTAGSLRTDPNNGLLDLPDVTSCIVRDPAHVLGLPHQCPIGGIPQIWTTRVDNGLVMNYEALCP